MFAVLVIFFFFQAEDGIRDRNVTGVQTCALPIYERTRELREANQAKDEFLALLAHELRNPLAPIMNAVGLIGARGGSDPVLQQATQVIERQAQQMARLLDDLLDVSRISRGKLQLRKEIL